MMLACEVAEDKATVFLKKEMASFVKTMLEDPAVKSSQITGQLIKSYNSSDMKIIGKYELTGESVIIKENEWTAIINVVTQHGAIESWTAIGTIKPLAVGTFSKALLEPHGTVAGWTYVGGRSDPCR